MSFLTDIVSTKIQKKNFSWHMAHVRHTTLPVRYSLFLSDCWTVFYIIFYLSLHLKLGRWACISQRQSASPVSESAVMENKQQQEGRSRGGEKRRNDNNYIFFQASVKWQPRNWVPWWSISLHLYNSPGRHGPLWTILQWWKPRQKASNKLPKVTQGLKGQTEMQGMLWL